MHKIKHHVARTHWRTPEKNLTWQRKEREWEGWASPVCVCCEIERECAHRSFARGRRRNLDVGAGSVLAPSPLAVLFLFFFRNPQSAPQPSLQLERREWSRRGRLGGRIYLSCQPLWPPRPLLGLFPLTLLRNAARSHLCGGPVFWTPAGASFPWLALQPFRFVDPWLRLSASTLRRFVSGVDSHGVCWRL